MALFVYTDQTDNLKKIPRLNYLRFLDVMGIDEKELEKRLKNISKMNSLFPNKIDCNSEDEKMTIVLKVLDKIGNRFYVINNFDDNKKNGEWWTFYGNGELESTSNFNDGKSNGKHFSYYKNRNVKYKGEFNNGMREGFWKFYFENGKLDEIGCYLDDEKNGIWKEFCEISGQLEVESDFSNGKLLKKTKFSKIFEGEEVTIGDTVFDKGGLVMGEAVGKAILTLGYKREDYMDKELIKIISGDLNQNNNLNRWRNKKKVGIWREYYSTGQLKSLGQYNDGIKVGKWIFYLENGKIKENFFINGEEC